MTETATLYTISVVLSRTFTIWEEGIQLVIVMGDRASHGLVSSTQCYLNYFSADRQEPAVSSRPKATSH